MCVCMCVSMHMFHGSGVEVKDNFNLQELVPFIY